MTAMAMRKAGFVAAAAIAALLLVVAAPSLLARGGAGGGRGGANDGTDVNGDGGGQPVGGDTTGPTGNIGSSPSDKGVGPDGDGKRDGAEQDAIARDALDGRGRADFRALRDARNRSSVEPVRGADRK
jgi:hypothetical protein